MTDTDKLFVRARYYHKMTLEVLEEEMLNKDARIAELEAALNLADKLAISVLGLWDAFEPAPRSDIGNTNYRCVAEKVAEYRAALAALNGDKR